MWALWPNLAYCLAAFSKHNCGTKGWRELMPLCSYTFSFYIIVLQFTTHSSHNLTCFKFTVNHTVWLIVTKILFEPSRTLGHSMNLHDRCCTVWRSEIYIVLTCYKTVFLPKIRHAKNATSQLCQQIIFLDYNSESMFFPRPSWIVHIFLQTKLVPWMTWISDSGFINTSLFPQLTGLNRGRLSLVQRCEKVLHVVLQWYWS